MTDRLRTVADLRAALAARGAGAAHARGVVQAWLRGRDVARAPASPGYRRPREFEARLPEVRDALRALATEVYRETGAGGARRRLVRLTSGRTVETVDLPRDGLCVSTQVGCAVGCTFCKTGESGLLQQLDALEILAQVALVRRERPVRRVVFMGMGEPSHNLDAVLDAIAALGVEGGLPHKNLVFSTVGSPPVFARLLAGSVRPGLALSLHALDAARRAALLPRAPRVAPDALLDAALDYADRVAYPLQIQWTLLDGVNDGLDEAARLARQVAGRRGIVNYIPYNALEGHGYRRPPIERCVELVRTVRAGGAVATLRFSAGQDVEAGCGQLRPRPGAPVEPVTGQKPIATANPSVTAPNASSQTCSRHANANQRS